MPDAEIANADAHDGVPAMQQHATSEPHTAAEKIKRTLKELSKPDEDADGLELGLASLAMAVEGTVGDGLEEKQASGEVDEFVAALTRFLAIHRSDDAKQLVVVELPRRQLPAGTRLHLLDQAIAAADSAPSPF
jgi:hypothetical protein